MRDRFGPLNPMRTEYMADLIAEVDRRMADPQFDDECNPIRSAQPETNDSRRKRSRRLKRA